MPITNKVDNHVLSLYRKWMQEGLISHDNAMWALNLIYINSKEGTLC